MSILIFLLQPASNSVDEIDYDVVGYVRREDNGVDEIDYDTVGYVRRGENSVDEANYDVVDYVRRKAEVSSTVVRIAKSEWRLTVS